MEHFAIEISSCDGIAWRKGPGGLKGLIVNFYGTNTFGVTLLPMLIGVAILFWNGRSALGWLLTAARGLFILAAVIANLHIYFAPTSLFNTLVMMVLLVGGLALIARALQSA